MIPGMLAGGAALGLGGSILGAYGQGQAAKSMAEERQRQLAEQMRIQQEGLRNARGFVQQNHPANTLATAYQAPNAIAQGELAKLGAAGHAAGLGTGNAGAGLASLQNANMGHQAVENQLAAPGLAQQHYGMRLADLGNKQAALEEQARRKAALYEQQLAAAGQAGLGARTLGSLAGLGGAGLSTAGMLMNPSGGAFMDPGTGQMINPATTTAAQADMSNAMNPMRAGPYVDPGNYGMVGQSPDIWRPSPQIPMSLFHYQ